MGTVNRLGQAIVAFLVLPGTVAFAVPLWLIRPPVPDSGTSTAGFIVAGLGVVLLGWCVVAFFTTGRGTLAPWAPPERLVRLGPYRVSRNPMYVGVLVILAGWAMAFRSTGLGVYAAVVAIAFHLRILLAEEPWLARTFPQEWPAYARRVPRWLGSVSGRGHEHA